MIKVNQSRPFYKRWTFWLLLFFLLWVIGVITDPPKQPDVVKEAIHYDELCWPFRGAVLRVPCPSQQPYKDGAGQPVEGFYLDGIYYTTIWFLHRQQGVPWWETTLKPEVQSISSSSFNTRLHCGSPSFRARASVLIECR